MKLEGGGRYTPDNWVVLKFDVEGSPVIYKVLCGWSGGYLDSDVWQMNSGITVVFDREDKIDFYGSSGSCYTCYKNSYGLRMNNAGMYNRLKAEFGDGVEMLAEDTDWSSMKW